MDYNWCSQKKKSAVHAASSLRQIILLVVCNTVKYGLQSVQLLAVKHTNGDVYKRQQLARAVVCHCP